MAATSSSLKPIAERISKLAAAKHIHFLPLSIAAAGSKSAVGAAATLTDSNFVARNPFLVQPSQISDHLMWNNQLFRYQVPVETMDFTRFMDNEKPISVEMEMRRSSRKDEESDVDFGEDGDKIYGEDGEEDSDEFFDDDDDDSDEFDDSDEGDYDEEVTDRGRREK